MTEAFREMPLSFLVLKNKSMSFFYTLAVIPIGLT